MSNSITVRVKIGGKVLLNMPLWELLAVRAYEGLFELTPLDKEVLFAEVEIKGFGAHYDDTLCLPYPVDNDPGAREDWKR